MKQGNFRKVISSKLQQQSLNHDQLAQLSALQSRQPVRKRRNILSFAAAFLAITFTAIVIQQSIQTSISIEQKIGNEVAKNHIKLKPLEVQSSQLLVMRDYFTELDFSPIASSNISFDRKVLLGGRYCSIQGITAAQLRLKDSSTGSIQSLYQTTYDPELFKTIPDINKGQQPVTVHAKGLEIEIWVEKGLLFALTKD